MQGPFFIMEQQELIPHLFRTEFRKIVSVLCAAMGIEHIEIAEDIAGETFLSALESWPFRGIPENPAAWLYTVAKNKAKNHIARSQLFARKIAGELRYAATGSQEPEIDLSESNIADSQLRMLFAICHPLIPAEAQIGLALRILCGFGIDEIASALLSNKEAINKRLFRAREQLRAQKVSLEFPGEDAIDSRLETVLTTLYLLFSEGYYSESNDVVLQEDLCLEAMRLTYLLIEHERTNLPAVNALLALMCFQASRFAARRDHTGAPVLYDDQDEGLWDQALISRGIYYLNLSAKGETISKFHLEASIAYWHTKKEDTPEKWEQILQLFNRLLQVAYSPIAALNRTYALAKANGKQQAIAEAEKLQLTDNHFYYVLLGDLYTGTDNATAKQHFEHALLLARTQTDKKTIRSKIMKL